MTSEGDTPSSLDDDHPSQSLRDGSDEPLLLDGSTGRPRPRKFTFADFMAISPGPNTLPWTLRTVAGTLLFVSMFGMLPLFALFLPFFR